MSTVNLVEKLYREHNLTDSELKEILLTTDSKVDKALQKYAQKVRDKVFGKNVYIRGLIEVSNYCKNDCYYCGIRRSNKNICRYRLTKEQILDCCKKVMYLVLGLLFCKVVKIFTILTMTFVVS